MSEPEVNETPPPISGFRGKVIFNFGLFFFFFVFYIGAALIQTPGFETIAMKSIGGMPLGLLLSLAIFPLSWVLMVIWFRKGR